MMFTGDSVINPAPVGKDQLKDFSPAPDPFAL